MKLFLTKYFLLGILSITSCFYSFNLAQNKQIDSLSLVNKYLQQAQNNTYSHHFDQALENVSQAKKIEHSLKDSTQVTIGKTHYTNGLLNYFIHDYDQASVETVEAIAFFNKDKVPLDLANAYHLYALILTQLENHQAAKEYLTFANDIIDANPDLKTQGKILSGLGYVALKNKNYKPAINYFEAALPILINNNQKYYQAFTYLHEAEAFINFDKEKNQNHLLEIKQALKKAQNISESENFLDILSESYRVETAVALLENEISKAESLLEKHTSSKDTLLNLYVSIASKDKNIDKNLEHLNEVITAQQEELVSKQKAIVFGRTTAGLALTLMIILSLFALSLFKNNKLRAIANDLLRDKNVELILSKEKAEKASIAKAHFLSTITDELRTPLYAVTGLTHLLLESNPNNEQKEHLNSLKFSGEYLLSLINNILDLNKLEANKVEIDKTSFNLKKRLSDVLIALKRTAEDRQNKIHLEYDETIPDKLMGDSLKLSQIFINLIGNAVKFTQNGDIWIRVKKLNQQAGKVSIHFEIEDSGVGISKKKQKSIFETFSQGSLQINRKFGGSGLGLSIVKNLLELMNSKIHLESELGQGSKFWFDIPFTIAEDSKEKLKEAKTNQIVDYKALENVKVLIVEDNKINQMITKKILEKNKMICDVADNGEDAIEMVKKNTYNLILMDIHMPGISGIVATQKIREFNKNIPILALTAVTIEDNLDEFYRAGFNEIIPKPFKPEEFFEKIYRALFKKV